MSKHLLAFAVLFGSAALALAATPKKLLVVQGAGHNNAMIVGAQDYGQAIAELREELADRRDLALPLLGVDREGDDPVDEDGEDVVHDGEALHHGGGGADGDLRRLAVAYLAHHDDVGVLAEN